MRHTDIGTDGQTDRGGTAASLNAVSWVAVHTITYKLHIDILFT